MSRISKHYSVNSTTLLDWKRQLLGVAVNNPRLYETIEHFCLGRRHLESDRGGSCGEFVVKELDGIVVIRL